AAARENPLVERTVELALFTVLFTDGTHFALHEITSAWQLPGRALLLGLPLTLLGTAILARVTVGLPWLHALLLGTALSPTDPVCAAALVGREEVPARLRHLLNVESGLSDGLALPVLILLSDALGPEDALVTTVLAQVAGGVSLGVAVPWLAVLL